MYTEDPPRRITIERLDDFRVDGVSYDETINELINIYETEELTLFCSGD